MAISSNVKVKVVRAVWVQWRHAADKKLIPVDSGHNFTCHYPTLFTLANQTAEINNYSRSTTCLRHHELCSRIRNSWLLSAFGIIAVSKL